MNTVNVYKHLTNISIRKPIHPQKIQLLISTVSISSSSFLLQHNFSVLAVSSKYIFSPILFWICFILAFVTTTLFLSRSLMTFLLQNSSVNSLFPSDLTCQQHLTWLTILCSLIHFFTSFSNRKSLQVFLILH